MVYQKEFEARRKVYLDSVQDAAKAMRLDAPSGVFFARELEEIDAELFNIKRPELEALQFLNVKQISPGAKTYTYTQFDGRGIAKVITDMQNGFPAASVSGQQFSANLVGVGASWHISFQEMREAAFAQTPLDSMLAEAAQRSVLELTNDIALSGKSEFGMYGLYNQPSATIVSGNGGWDSASAADILEDLFGIVDSIPTLTKEVEKANMLLLPYNKLRFISTKLLGTASDTTVLEFFKMQRPGVEVRGALKLETASAGGAHRMVAYDKNCCKWLVAVPIETLPLQSDGIVTKVNYHARLGGVVAYRPLAIAYLDAI
jgi:hypothetical protein